MSQPSASVEPTAQPSDDGVLVVRPGGGANCSSVGSVVDLLFVTGAVGGALLVAITAALDDLETEPPAPAPAADPDAPTE